MRQLELDVIVPEREAELLGQAASLTGTSLPELLSAAAAAYARRNAGPAATKGKDGLRKPISWGPRSPSPGEEDTIHVVLGPEVLDLVEAVRRRVRWEEQDGSTLPVTLEEYVLGAAGRLIRAPRDAERLAPELFPGRIGSTPAKGPVSTGPAAPPGLLGAGWTPVRWALIGIGAITVLSLVAALTLALRSRRPAMAAAGARPAAAVEPGPAAASEEPDAGAAGAAVAKWEHLAERAPEPPPQPVAGPGRDHTREIDKLLKSHLAAGGRRDAAYDQAIDTAVRDVADLYPVTAPLVKAIIRQESDFNPKARSRVGAIGLMQLMPFNAPKVGLREAELWIPERNILGGTRLIAALLRYYNGDMVAALAAYNAKPRNPFAPLPRNGETPAYVAAVLRYYDEYTRSGGGGLGQRAGSP
jgi:soluble lytic murein transglycosylase-like protein